MLEKVGTTDVNVAKDSSGMTRDCNVVKHMAICYLCHDVGRAEKVRAASSTDYDNIVLGWEVVHART